MERNTEHDAELAARLARLDARRQSAGVATSRQGVEAPSPSATRPGATRTKRRHPAHRSRIGVTIGSVAAMVGLTGAMVMSEQASSSAAVTTDAAANVTVLTVAATTATTAATTTATTNPVALSATPATAAAQVTTTTAAQVTTTSKGS